LLVVAGYLVSRPWALDVYAVVGCVAVIVMVLLPRLYYSHYGSFVAPFLVLAVALPAGRLLAWAGELVAAGRSGRAGTSARAGAGAGAVVAATIAVVLSLPLLWLGVRAVQALTPTAGGPSVAVASRLIPPGSCVLTDTPSYTVAADRFITRPGCPALVDSQGTLIAMTDGAELNASPAERAPVVAVWLAGFKQAQYVWLFPGDWTRVPWNRELYSYFTSHFHLIAFGAPADSTRVVPPTGLYKRT
jgi:hypothetical protein